MKRIIGIMLVALMAMPALAVQHKPHVKKIIVKKECVYVEGDYEVIDLEQCKTLTIKGSFREYDFILVKRIVDLEMQVKELQEQNRK